LADPGTQQKFIGMLSRVQLFSQMSDAFRLAACKALRPVRYEAGEVVFRQHEQGDWMAVLLRGSLDCHCEAPAHTVLQRGENPGTHKIKGVSPGGTCGDINVLGVSEERVATVTAAVPSTVLVLSRADFKAAVSTPKDAAFVDSTRQLHDKVVMDSRSFSNLPCFKKLNFSRDYATALFDHVERRLLYPGHVVMREGGFGNEMYIIDAGQMKIEQASLYSTRIVATLSDGATVGELAVLGSDKNRRATVVCMTPCVVSILDGDIMNEVLKGYPNSKGAFDAAYVKTLVGDGLTSATDEVHKLNQFYGKVHPLTVEQMVGHGFGGPGLAQIHKTRERMKSSSSRPSTARRYVPTKVPSRPSTALGVRSARCGSPALWERQCHSACN